MYQSEMAYTDPLAEGQTKSRFDVSGWKRSFNERMPSLDKSLDRYFSTYMESIVQEWDLLTEMDLLRLEGRLKKITAELNHREEGHAVLAERARALNASVKELEGRR
ncbi:MAG: hypothetical protein LUQ64_04470 [Methanomicrobiales archaeon]|nr:hypothetical protein [Methanomicrobiales archaeon]MDD1653781.1 hypothetical protein [Methanomicrobiales archaeon]